jgi:CRP/FNR family transcriptional regulator, anaerobic regulatory protein
MMAVNRPRQALAKVRMETPCKSEVLLDAALSRLEQEATSVSTRRHQKLAVETKTGRLAYVVRSGVVIVQATILSNRPQMLAILYPGDIFSSMTIPPTSSASLTAAAAVGEVWAFPEGAYDSLVEQDTALAKFLLARASEQSARHAMHAILIGGLTGEERMAALLAELALKTGTRAQNGSMTFEMVLSRADLADYLALNPDTVSRIMSRLKSRGLISQISRRHVVCRDVGVLLEESRAKRVLEALHPSPQTRPNAARAF